jgi:hypothetical protein
MRTNERLEHIWNWHYLGPAVGYIPQGQCAACDYSGPIGDFRVWYKPPKYRVLCNQCSSDVSGTMRHEGWTREE